MVYFPVASRPTESFPYPLHQTAGAATAREVAPAAGSSALPKLASGGLRMASGRTGAAPPFAGMVGDRLIASELAADLDLHHAALRQSLAAGRVLGKGIGGFH